MEPNEYETDPAYADTFPEAGRCPAGGDCEGTGEVWEAWEISNRAIPCPDCRPEAYGPIV